ncbi:hypothetical protein [Aeoliella mucimassa]|nr:hypothetical protein [Aeoliella mucimassa]
MASLDEFLNRELVPQMDETDVDAEGTLVATFNDERFCGPTSLVRNFFTFQVSLFGAAGESDLESDLEYHPQQRTFTPRRGHYFYLWTPARKRNAQEEKERIDRMVQDFKRTHRTNFRCPLCTGKVSGVDNPGQLDVRCTENRCFVYSYHKDEKGRILHGRFMVKHPAAH